jgi:hypothetical protein
MAVSDMRRALLLLGLAAFLPASAIGQSAGEVERCFQNPAACSTGGTAAPAPGPGTGGGAPVAAARPAAPPDYTTVLQSAEPDRKRIQESLRTLDKYNGPIDGNLQSEAIVKAIGDWQKGRGTPVVGKLTPAEAQQLNAEAAKAPIRRIEPSTQAATLPTSNADGLKALRDRLAERRKAAEPKADAAAQSLIRDLKAYIAADGKGAAGEQFATFAKWYADNKTAGRTMGDIVPVIDDYGDAKMGAAATAEIRFETKQSADIYRQCLVFAWIEGTPRKSTQAFSCDDVAAVEKWKTEQSLKSAWR